MIMTSSVSTVGKCDYIIVCQAGLLICHHVAIVKHFKTCRIIFCTFFAEKILVKKVYWQQIETETVRG